MRDTATVNFVFRRYREECDAPLVFNSWCSGVRGKYPLSNVDSGSFKEFHRLVLLESLVERCGVRIACSVEDRDFVFGWCVSELVGDTYVVHFVYVKEIFRGFGIAKSLLMDNEEYRESRKSFFTFKTPSSSMVKKVIDAKYDPYRVFRGDSNENKVIESDWRSTNSGSRKQLVLDLKEG